VPDGAPAVRRTATGPHHLEPHLEPHLKPDDLQFDYSDLKEDTSLTGAMVDPDLPWTVGAVPAQPLGEVALVHTSIGPTLMDALGSPHSFVAQSIVDRLGARGVRLRPKILDMGGSGVGSALHGRAETAASFLMTIHISYQTQQHKAQGVGPFCREFGADLTDVYVVPDAHLASMQGAHAVAPVLLLGADALKLRPLENLWKLALQAGFDRASDNYVALWSHPQLQRKDVESGGAYYKDVHLRPSFSVEVPYDVPHKDPIEDISAMNPSAGIFGRDGPPQAVWHHGRSERADTHAAMAHMNQVLAVGRTTHRGVPQSRAELRDRLMDGLRSQRVSLDAPDMDYLKTFLEPLVDILWEMPQVVGDPSPRGIPLDFDVADGPPILLGLKRIPAPDAHIPLWNENARLRGFDFVEQVEAGPDGGPPPGFHVNPIVVALKQLNPGEAPDAQRQIRFCLDMSFLNSRVEGYLQTVLPDLADYVESFMLKLLFSNIDLASAFHQRLIHPDKRKYLGYMLIDPATGQRTYWQFRGAVFGLTSVPREFQRMMEDVLSASTLIDALTALRVFIDNIDASTGRPPGAAADLDAPDPTSPEGQDLGTRHLAVLRSVFKALDGAGLTINIKKSLFLRRQFHSMGLVGDGKGRRLDPERLRQWDSFSVPDAPSLKWLGGVVGMIMYSSPFIHAPGADFCDLMDPLYNLLATATNLKRAAKTEYSLRERAKRAVADGWTAAHTTSVEKLRDYIKQNSILHFLDLTREAVATCDASDYGFCCTLLQYDPITGDPKVVFKVIHRWTAPQRKWTIGVKECFGWLALTRKYRRYLYLLRCRFRGDHLNHLTIADLQHGFVQRHLCELMQWPDWRRYFHCRGNCNILCDFDSRYSDKALTMVDEAPPQPDGSAAQDTYYFHTDVAGAPSVRRILTAGDCLPFQFDLFFAPSAEREAPGTLLVRRVTRATVEGGLVEHFNHHRPQLTPLMTNIINAQAAMSPDEVAEYSKLRKTSSATLGDASLRLVGGLVYVPPSATAVREEVFETILHSDGTLHAGLAKARVILDKHGLYVGGGFDSLYQAFYDSCKCQHARTPVERREGGSQIPNPQFAPLAHVSMDMASLPPSGDFVGICITVDSASRAATVVPVKSFEAEAAIMALKDWATRWQWPEIVHSDGGPCFASKVFKTFAAGHGILVDIGTAEHPRGRGQVESLVGLFKRAIKGILPQGQLERWPEVLEDLMIGYMASPQIRMGGFSPFEYLVAKPPTRFASLFSGTLKPQAREDTMLALECIRSIVDFVSELSAVKRAAASAPDPLLHKFTEGAWVLVYQPHQKTNSLEPLYQGPYRITLVERNLSDTPTGWFTVREIYAGDSEATPRMGPPLELHSTRMWPFNHSRTTAAAEHSRRLPLGLMVVEAILDGPNDDGKFLVKWHTVAEPRWEWPAGLAHLTLFDEFCKEHGCSRDNEHPIQWRPASLKAEPTMEPPTDSQRTVCACGKSIKNTPAAIKQHVQSQYHIAHVAHGTTAPPSEGGADPAPIVGGGATRTSPRARLG
jgi:hypothetical protein